MDSSFIVHSHKKENLALNDAWIALGADRPLNFTNFRD